MAALNGQVRATANCMIGSNSASLIADSYLKGIRGYDIETLYKAILKNTDREQVLFLQLEGLGQNITMTWVMFLIMLALMRMLRGHLNMPMPISAYGNWQQPLENHNRKLIFLQKEQ